MSTGSVKAAVLLVMRVEDMHRHHPDEVILKCDHCLADVAVYPSGQKVMEQYPGNVELACNRCRSPGPGARLAPGAIDEPGQSRGKQ